MPASWIRKWLRLGPILPLVVSVIGCMNLRPAEVIVYSAVDRKVAQPVLDEFARVTGTIVHSQYATTPADLAQTNVDEGSPTRCDLFWSDELLASGRLEQAGLLRPRSPQSPYERWHAFAPRARVLLVNTNQIPEARRPRSIRDLVDPQWYERCAIARPIAGLPASQAACWFQVLGEAEARELFRSIKRNARILESDREVANAVATGQVAFGLTNIADANRAVSAGYPAVVVYPDQGDGQLGTLFVPYTVVLLKDSPNPVPANQLFDFVTSPAVAARLAAPPPSAVRATQVDYRAAANSWPAAEEFLRDEFAP